MSDGKIFTVGTKDKTFKVNSDGTFASRDVVFSLPAGNVSKVTASTATNEQLGNALNSVIDSLIACGLMAEEE
jgi:hypothetical protein